MNQKIMELADMGVPSETADALMSPTEERMEEARESMAETPEITQTSPGEFVVAGKGRMGVNSSVVAAMAAAMAENGNAPPPAAPQPQFQEPRRPSRILFETMSSVGVDHKMVAKGINENPKTIMRAMVPGAGDKYFTDSFCIKLAIFFGQPMEHWFAIRAVYTAYVARKAMESEMKFIHHYSVVKPKPQKPVEIKEELQFDTEQEATPEG